MDQENVARWMQEEHTKVEELMQAVREKMTVPPRGGREGWLTAIRERFDHLRAHMIKHMSMEEKDGYMAAVLECRPTLSKAVESLENDHRQFIRILDSIHRELHDASPDDGMLLRDACGRIEDCLSHLANHERRENLLVSSAFTQDIGDND